MHAQQFIGDADYPNIIDKADDGTPLPDCRGWMCDNCGTLYVDRAAAEVCCIEPDAVKPALRLPSFLIGCIALIFLSCGGIGLAHEERLVGKLGLVAVDTRADMALYVLDDSGHTSKTLIPPTVIAVGWDDQHLIAKRRPPDEPQIEYYIVEVQDAKVHGPFDEKQFAVECDRQKVSAKLDFTRVFSE